jgi:carbamate kinase
VASPEPQRVLEESAIRLLLDAGALVIRGGGGGVPVVQDGSGRLTGLEAVVDKDLTVAAIAVTMNADRMLLLTDVPAVMRDFGMTDAVASESVSLADVAELHLPAGSMGPKVQDCARVTSAIGHLSSIGVLTDAAAVLGGTAGTTITTNRSAGTASRVRAGDGSRP